MKLIWILGIVFVSCHDGKASAILPGDTPLVVASFSEPLSVSGITTNSTRTNSSVPLFYGWFFNEITAESISIIGKKYFLAAYDTIPEFQAFVRQLMLEKNVSNPLEFYTKPLDPDSGLPDLKYHTTAKFCGKKEEKDFDDPAEECDKYLQQVGQYLGRPYRIHFVGLFFTNNTYGIRVKLTAEEQKLFREDTRVNSAQQSETEPNNEVERIAREESGRHFAYEPYYYSHQGVQTGRTNPFYPGIKFRPQEKNFHPTESRAHVTLGCAPNIPAVQTGLDLLSIIDLEVSSFAQHNDYEVDGEDIPKAVLREFTVTSDAGYSEVAAFVLYPGDEMIADSTFDAYL